MKIFQLALWAAIFLLGAFLAYSTISWTLNRDQPASYGRADIGGEFSAVRTDGADITWADLKGRPHVLFFGFTHCPDICPTTLYEAGQWLEALGTDAEKLDIYFVTVDPERDTKQVLAEYLTGFDKRIRGITGTQEQVAAMLKKWRVYSEKVPEDDGDYTMNHQTTTFLMKADGSFLGTIAYGENKDVAVKKLKRLADASS